MSLHRTDVAVFAGPSWHTAEVAALFPGERLFPPASSGDLLAASNLGVKRIVLADTLFLDAAPSHDEILDVINRGVSVIGCSSAGALRATELAKFGMTGHGTIYQIVQDTLFFDDGELAVLIDSGGRAIAPPLIELRYYLGYLVDYGHPFRAISDAFQKIKSMYFMERTISYIFEILNAISPLHSNETSLLSDLFRLKRHDLESCLKKWGTQSDSRRHFKHNKRWVDIGLMLDR